MWIHSNGSVMHTSTQACFYFFYNPYIMSLKECFRNTLLSSVAFELIGKFIAVDHAQPVSVWETQVAGHARTYARKQVMAITQYSSTGYIGMALVVQH